MTGTTTTTRTQGKRVDFQHDDDLIRALTQPLPSNILWGGGQRTKPRAPNADGTFTRGGASKPQPPIDSRVQQVQNGGVTGGGRVPDAGGLTGADKLIDYTTRNEGKGDYGAINPNDNGAGLSYGIIQFNQKKGTLPELFQRMNAADPAKFRAIFGADADKLLDASTVRTMNLNTPDMIAKLKEAGQVPAFQQAQRDLAKDVYFKTAQELATKYGIKSERGMAMLFDAVVQMPPDLVERKLAAAKQGGGGERDVLARFAQSADRVAYANGRRAAILRDPNLSDGPM